MDMNDECCSIQCYSGYVCYCVQGNPVCVRKPGGGGPTG